MMLLGSSRRERRVLFFASIIALLIVVFYYSGSNANRSPEVGVATLSPRGLSGGYAIPASCPSYAHNPGECGERGLDLVHIDADTIRWDPSTWTPLEYEWQTYYEDNRCITQKVSEAIMTGPLGYALIFRPSTFAAMTPLAWFPADTNINDFDWSVWGFGYETDPVPACFPAGDGDVNAFTIQNGPVAYPEPAPSFVLSWEIGDDTVQDLSNSGFNILANGCTASGAWSGTKQVIQTTGTYTWCAHYTGCFLFACNCDDIRHETVYSYGASEWINNLGEGVHTFTLSCGAGAYNYTDSVTVTVGNPEPASCGNGTIDPGETCDDGALLNGQYGQCASDCSGPGPRCGDGIVQPTQDEECDGSIGGQSCESRGYDGGILSCTSSCQFDESRCVNIPPSSCGDNICNGTETCSTCPADCGQCPGGGTVCSDNIDNESRRDGLVDENDPACWGPGGGDEYDFSCLDLSPSELLDPGNYYDPVTGEGCYNPDTDSEDNCGNGLCEAWTGENILRCPLDCIFGHYIER